MDNFWFASEFSNTWSTQRETEHQHVPWVMGKFVLKSYTIRNATNLMQVADFLPA